MTTKAPGRPPIHDEKMLRITVHLRSNQYLAAVAAGSGNVSVGLRALLDELVAYREWHQAELRAGAMPAPREKHQ